MSTPRPPKVEKRPHKSIHHGIERVDDYAWLRADNWREVMKNPDALPADIRACIEAENAYQQAMMADTEALQERLFAEMKGRIKEDDSSVPVTDGPYAYATTYTPGDQHPRIIRTPRDGGVEEVLLNANAEAQGHDYFNLGDAEPSPDHRWLAWAADTRGSEYFTIRLRDLETGADTDTAITDTTGDVVWAEDGKHLFYVRHDDEHRPRFVYRHRLGTDPAQDALIYEEPDAGFFVGIGKTSSKRFITIHAHDHETSEVRLIDAHDPTAAPILVAARERGVEYDVDEAGGTLYIRTNADGAEDYKIVMTAVATPGREHWRELVGHRPGRLILSHLLSDRFMARLERENGLPGIVITDLHGGREHDIAFSEAAYSLSLSVASEDFDSPLIRFTYSSPTTPARTYDYDMATGERVLRKEQEVPSGHDPADYVTRRIFAPAHDGEEIPVTLLWHKDTPLDGSAPVWLYGYGAYGYAIPAAFSTARLSLVDRGMIYAIAHVRGGKEKGYRWYRLGKREHKVNTFRDFISVAEHLIGEGHTRKGRIVAHGGSAGGMLMGAVANMAPDLFAAIVAEVPFVDVLTTMLDDTLPLTPPEWPEWGNPIESKADYLTIAAYSPYDNVREQAYPAILAVAGLTDPRVTYWEPAKWVAKLREKKRDANPLLLKTHMGAGHGGASGRFEHLKDIALVYAFGLKATGRAEA
ncbi:MAG TPA: S9 family peptidase [Thermopetrobacter sp.]|nr:S9 family peptidase [Thermopetrobacter sp.]